MVLRQKQRSYVMLPLYWSARTAHPTFKVTTHPAQGDVVGREDELRQSRSPYHRHCLIRERQGHAFEGQMASAMVLGFHCARVIEGTLT
jgi:hypothetical protein